MTRAQLDKEPHDVAAMFDDVAERYDVTNDVLSLGPDASLAARGGRGRRPAARGSGCSTSRPGPGPAASPSAPRAPRSCRATSPSGCSGSGKRRQPGLAFTAGDALRLPFVDASFDAVTISFGLRNVSDTSAALAEMLRVTRPGGRLVVCEFSHPTWAPFRTIYVEYLMRALPPTARAVSSNPDAYVYLAESIRAWPDQAGLAAVIIGGAGWSRTAWRDLSGGIVALHRATRP